MAHCADVACTALTPAPPRSAAPGPGPEGGSDTYVYNPSLVIGAGGRALVSYLRRDIAPVDNPPNVDFRIRRCADAVCSSFTSDVAVPTAASAVWKLPIAIDGAGKPWYVRASNARVRLVQCADDACQTSTDVSCAETGQVDDLSFATGADAQPFAAFHLPGADDLGALHGFGPCAPSSFRVDDRILFENFDPLGFASVYATPPLDFPATVDFTTVAGTAQAGVDYSTTSGTLTFAAGDVLGRADVTSLPDALDEDDEAFQVVLQNPIGAVLGDASATMTIWDDDPLPILGVSGCDVVEGTGPSIDCAVTISLAVPSGREVSVGLATADETATAGADYVAASGVVTFAPGVNTRTVNVSVAGDAAPEIDETFRIDLATPTNAVVLEASTQGIVLDDDTARLSGHELAHGSVIHADLAAQPGPTADADVYRLAHPPFSSWEVRADGVSGDVAPGLLLERLGADTATVLQTGTAVGTGGSVSLRFENRFPIPLVSNYLRVRSAGCSTDCGADDVYRLRAYDTTARFARFNNTETQVTALVLQSTGRSGGARVDRFLGARRACGSPPGPQPFPRRASS